MGVEGVDVGGRGGGSVGGYLSNVVSGFSLG